MKSLFLIDHDYLKEIRDNPGNFLSRLDYYLRDPTLNKAETLKAYGFTLERFPTLGKPYHFAHIHDWEEERHAIWNALHAFRE